MSHFRTKHFFSAPAAESLPELKVKPIGDFNSSMEDIVGDKLVFKLRDRGVKRRKVREGEAANNIQLDVHFEAQVDMLNGKHYLDIENEDMTDLKMLWISMVTEKL